MAVLIQSPRGIVRQSIRLAEDCGFSILPPGQTVVSADPDASVCCREHGLRGIAGQTLFHRNRRDGQFSEAVQSASAGDPDVSLTILKNAQDDVAREAISSRKYIGSSAMHMD